MEFSGQGLNPRLEFLSKLIQKIIGNYFFWSKPVHKGFMYLNFLQFSENSNKSFQPSKAVFRRLKIVKKKSLVKYFQLSLTF